jgi:DNA-binding transcriptional MocR family regulator
MEETMADIAGVDKDHLAAHRASLRKRYDAFKSKGLALDMTRGKPCAEQLDLSMDMLKCLGRVYTSAGGVDCRNYGGVDGLPEAKQLFAELLGVGAAEVIVGGNSSLNLMHDTIARALSHGVVGSDSAWAKLPEVSFVCPSPGYDRHFSICQHFGIKMVTVDMTEAGPDMDEVERLVACDASVKGIWCVPKYSNPTGVVFSDEVVDRLAGMKTAAKDFRIFWDNAYAVHDLEDETVPLNNLLAACKTAGNADRVFMFCSTSKVSFSGAGVGAMGGSVANMDWMRGHLSMQTIGPDKLNQLRHVKYFGNLDGIHAHMKKHAAIIKPKFDAVLSILEKELAGKGVASWSRPKGGYFVSLDVLDGCAKAVVAKAAEAGAKLTKAGATFPYGKDPHDRNIRIAPTLPSLADIEAATELLAVCVQFVAADRVLGA